MGTQNRVIGYLIWNYPTRCPLSKEHIVHSGSEERSQTLHLFGQFSYPHSFIFSNNWDRYFGNVLRGRRQSAQEVHQYQPYFHTLGLLWATRCPCGKCWKGAWIHEEAAVKRELNNTGLLHAASGWWHCRQEKEQFK